MGIVCHCPNGHRIKVTDRFAGKRGLCPTCGVTFRIGAASAAADESFASSGTADASDATLASLPLARFIPVDTAVLETLPRALPYGSGMALTAAEAADLVEEDAELISDGSGADGLESQPQAARPLPAVLLERADLTWCIAYPGGAPSEPCDAATMHDWLAGGQADGSELVWRADWPEWLPVRDVFPEFFPGA
ncbi:MAG: hypothetical protein ACKOTB_14480 [Planctomycetia bacterium]